MAYFILQGATVMWVELMTNSVTALQANAAVEPTLWVETVAGIGNCCNLTIIYNSLKVLYAS